MEIEKVWTLEEKAVKKCSHPWEGCLERIKLEVFLLLQP